MGYLPLGEAREPSPVTGVLGRDGRRGRLQLLMRRT